MKSHMIFPIFLVATSLVLTACGLSKGKESAQKAVNQFHEQLDQADFTGIYSAAHADFKAATTEKDFVALLDAVHRKLGTLQSTEQAGWNVNSFNFKTNVVIRYNTKFAEGDAVETFTYRIDGDKVLLLGYNINSHTLVTK